MNQYLSINTINQVNVVEKEDIGNIGLFSWFLKTAEVSILFWYIEEEFWKKTLI